MFPCNAEVAGPWSTPSGQELEEGLISRGRAEAAEAKPEASSRMGSGEEVRASCKKTWSRKRTEQSLPDSLESGNEHGI